jgi:hypothetical protein
MVVLRPHALERGVLLTVLGAPKACFSVVLPKKLTDLAPDDRYAAETAVVPAFSMQLSLHVQAGHSGFLQPLNWRISVVGTAYRKRTILAPD